MDPTHPDLLRTAFDEYLSALGDPVVPDDDLLSYDFSYVTDANLRFFSDAMLRDELREFTNRLHEWRGMLRRWHAWSKVVSVKEEMTAWELRSEFMEPLVHSCLLMPSSVRDLATFVGTNCLHQLRLHADYTYCDTLEGDPSSAYPNPPRLTRKKKEARLSRLAQSLVGFDQFMVCLRQIDDKTYRSQTSNYRNLSSHAIGPRLAIGQTNRVTRRVVIATRMELQSDGTGHVVEIPDRYVPSYGLGGLQPLDLEVARGSNLSQYVTSRECFAALMCLLKMQCAKLPQANV